MQVTHPSGPYEDLQRVWCQAQLRYLASLPILGIIRSSDHLLHPLLPIPPHSPLISPRAVSWLRFTLYPPPHDANEFVTGFDLENGREGAPGILSEVRTTHTPP